MWSVLSETGIKGPLGFKTLGNQRSLNLLSVAMPLIWLSNYISFWCLFILSLFLRTAPWPSWSHSFSVLTLEPSWLWLFGPLSVFYLTTFLHLHLWHNLSYVVLSCFWSHFHARLPHSLEGGSPWSRGLRSNSGELECGSQVRERGHMVFPSVKQLGQAVPFIVVMGGLGALTGWDPK